MSRLLCNTSEQRRCTQCKTIKALTSENYSKDKNRPLGFMYKCKQCEKTRVDKRTYKDKKGGMSEASKQRGRERNKRYRNTIPGKAISRLKSYELMDKKKGLQCTLTKQDLIDVMSKKCSYCSHAATGYDRVDNRKGHIKSNCIPCCGDCNTAKMDHFTYDEMLIIGQAIKQVKDNRISRLN